MSPGLVLGQVSLVSLLLDHHQNQTNMKTSFPTVGGLVTFLLIFTTQNLRAQEQAKYVYCEITTISRLMSNKVTIIIDFGDKMKFFAEKRLRDPATDKIRMFNTSVDALNFMGQQGWEFAHAYTVYNPNQTIFYYLMKKPIALLDEEEKAELSKN